jgi:iron complex transport system ATP-binding protein
VVKSANTDLLSIVNGCLGYDSHNPLILNINICIPLHSSIALTGDIGSGKTTLLKTIMNQIPLLAGNIYRSAEVFHLNRYVAFLPQRVTRMLPPLLKVSDLLSNAVGIYNNFPTHKYIHRMEKVYEVASILSIHHLIDRKVITLSGGEYQLVLIANILMNEVRLLILDEPFNNLDQSNRLNLIEALKVIKSKYDISLMCVLHDDNVYKHNIFTDEINLSSCPMTQHSKLFHRTVGRISYDAQLNL